MFRRNFALALVLTLASSLLTFACSGKTTSQTTEVADAYPTNGRETPSTPATATATSTSTVVPTPTKTTRVSVMADTNAEKTLCVAVFFDPKYKGSFEILFVNQKVCVFEGVKSLQGATFVHLVNPGSIAERNLWLDDVGEWLTAHNLDSCGLKTVYLTYLTSGPLHETATSLGVPGEKAMYQLGGTAKPSNCSPP